jgi:hypothetical protein
LPWESQGDYALVALEVTCDCSQVDGSEVEDFDWGPEGNFRTA